MLRKARVMMIDPFDMDALKGRWYSGPWPKHTPFEVIKQALDGYESVEDFVLRMPGVSSKNVRQAFEALSLAVVRDRATRKGVFSERDES